MTNWLEKDKKQLHPVYHPKSHANALVIERGEGVWLYTADGQKILDGMAGLWNINVGYGREELAKAAYDQKQLPDERGNNQQRQSGSGFADSSENKHSFHHVNFQSFRAPI